MCSGPTPTLSSPDPAPRSCPLPGRPGQAQAGGLPPLPGSLRGSPLRPGPPQLRSEAHRAPRNRPARADHAWEPHPAGPQSPQRILGGAAERPQDVLEGGAPSPPPPNPGVGQGLRAGLTGGGEGVGVPGGHGESRRPGVASSREGLPRELVPAGPAPPPSGAREGGAAPGPAPSCWGFPATCGLPGLAHAPPGL